MGFTRFGPTVDVIGLHRAYMENFNKSDSRFRKGGSCITMIRIIQDLSGR